MRIALISPPFRASLGYSVAEPWKTVSQWPASWVLPPEGREWEKPWVAAFRCAFTAEPAKRGGRRRERIHVTADERYELYLDGKWIGRGAERGDRGRWHYESYALDLAPGDHCLVACVWALGRFAPWAQVSIAPGFFCCPESEALIPRLATGLGPWEILPLRDRVFESMDEAAGTAMGAGPSERIDTRLTPWGWEEGKGTGWASVRLGEGGYHGERPQSTTPTHWLRPASLPPQRSRPWKRFRIFRAESIAPGDGLALLKEGKPVTLPARTRAVLLVDLDDYLCAYPELRWSGGAGSRISLGWAEALRDPETGEKRRAAVPLDSRFVGPADEVIADGGAGRRWRPLWWRCGCYVELRVEVGGEPLTLEGMTFFETGYPLRVESRWTTPDPELARLFAVNRRTLEACLHETYTDCPYYEQMMYVGDTRLQCLLTYALGREERPQRKALELFDASRANPTGLVTASYPSGGGQLIPPFALWWIAMVHDFARWRGHPDYIAARLPGVRAVLDLFRREAGVEGDGEGLVRGLAGWNFYDSEYRPGGIPKGCVPGGSSAVLQAHWILVLGMAVELEEYAGEPELAARYRRWRRAAVTALWKTFWDEERGLLADDAAHTAWSEQAQCLALLAGIFDGHARKKARVWKGLEEGTDLVRSSCYFAHYYLEACLDAGRADLFAARLETWREGLRAGFRTTPENFGTTRSDCHAWSAHPLYHYLTGVLGIRPGAGKFGFETVVIAPQLGSLPEASGELAHPLGPISVRITRRKGGFRAEIVLPNGLKGLFRAKGVEKPLRAGKQHLVW